MKKHILAASAGVVALAGLAWAAAGGFSGGSGGGFVLLPASSGGGAASAPRAIQPSPAADTGEFRLAADGRHIVDSYICVFRGGSVARGQERAEANRSANAAGGQVGHVYENTIRGFSVHASAQGVARMQAGNRNIDYCEQDQVMAVIDGVQAQARPGSGPPPAESTPYGIARVNGGGVTGGGAAWVIDTGIDLDHPDLNVDAARSRNFVTRETSPEDLNGHGSHVSGTIAAKKGNGIGVVGVSPGSTLVAIRVLNRNGRGSNSDVIAGVDWVGGHGVAGDVANMSLGGGVSQALDDAVVAASSRVKFALAAGNESEDANNHSPGRANGPNIYTISAVNSTDTFASFSNFGNPPVDYAEPGVSILSTWKDGGYNTISGTSMATPHMAGLLLIGLKSDGRTAKNDPDGNPDLIGLH